MKGTSKNPYFVTMLRYSQKIFPYISVVCCVKFFVPTLSYLEIRIFRGALKMVGVYPGHCGSHHTEIEMIGDSMTVSGLAF